MTKNGNNNNNDNNDNDNNDNDCVSSGHSSNGYHHQAPSQGTEFFQQKYF